MSVILDALRKSENQRKQEQPFKTLLPISPRATPPNSPKALIIAYVLIAILGLLLVASLIFQYKPSSIKQLAGLYANKTNVEKSIAAPLENNEKKTHTAPSLITQTNQDTLQRSNTVDTIRPSVTTIKKDTHEITPHAQQPSPVPLITKALASPKAGPDRAPLISELPHVLQQQIPPLTYVSHWFDKTSTQSIILINNISLKEGSRINNQLSVKSISATGTVLDFNGQLFFLPMLQSWPDEN
jgi:hypothetical protein